ncbi:MAG: cob(I)yrinic acid a,c-diamide adenosyltransferase, partial [Planctomycetota bacterium]
IGGASDADVGTTMDEQLQQIQNELFAIGAELASPEPEKFELRVIGDAHVQCLESWIDQHEQRVPPLTEFILPAGTNAAAQLHVSRGLCRRAERRVVSLIREQSADVSDSVLIYLNRLSDLLFVMSRVVNHDAGVQEVRWEKP